MLLVQANHEGIFSWTKIEVLLDFIPAVWLYIYILIANRIWIDGYKGVIWLLNVHHIIRNKISLYTYIYIVTDLIKYAGWKSLVEEQDPIFLQVQRFETNSPANWAGILENNGRIKN